MPMEKLNIANMAKGALVELAEVEIARVLDNIADPNTDPKKARSVDIKIKFKPLDRETAAIEIQTKSSIAPYNPVTSQIFIGKDAEGRTLAAEFDKGTIPGQVPIVDKETGEILAENKSTGKKIVNINR